MKILHTSDWHLGHQLGKYSRLEEQREVLEEICSLADEEQVDVVLIAGDLFDTFNPPSNATELFYRTLKRLSRGGKRAVVAIAGNHDSPERIEAPHSLAHECGIILSGYPHTVIHPFTQKEGFSLIHSAPGFIELQWAHLSYPLRLLMTPYANEARFRQIIQGNDELPTLLQNHWKHNADQFCDNLGVNLLILHLFMMKVGGEVALEPEDEKPILHVGGLPCLFTNIIPAAIQYVAAGHLHCPLDVSHSPTPVVYCGSPLAYSFSEAEQQKRVVIIDVEPGKEALVHSRSLYSGRPLYRKRFSSVEEAILWLQENPKALVELTLMTESYLSAEELNRLYAAHSGLVKLIPECTAAHQKIHPLHGSLLTKDITDLFTDYFMQKSGGQKPDEGILTLFKEVLATEEEQ